MAMQKKAWMIAYLFKQWLAFFYKSIIGGGGGGLKVKKKFLFF
jgi:hypothetical protein